MTQIAIVQPAAPPAPPAGPPPANSGSKQFSSHFEKAISDQKEQVSSRESKPAKSPDKLKGEEKTPAASTDSSVQETAPAVSPAQDVATDDAAVPAEDENLGMQDVQDLVTALSSEKHPAANSTGTITSSTTNPAIPATPAIPGNLGNPATPAIPATPAVSGQGETVALSQIATQDIIASSPASRNDISSALAEEASRSTAPPNGQKSTTDTLLAQLQQLIENSDEKGTVSITRENTPPLPANGARPTQMAWSQQVGGNNPNPANVTVTSQYSEVATESPYAVLADGWNTPAEKSEQGTSLRQNTQQQYYEAKINLQSFDNNEDSMAQDRQQGSESSAQGQLAAAGQTSSTATPLTGDQTNTFAQSLATTQPSSVQPATDTAKTLTLPSGTVVREEEVIQQVIERFQISRKTLDTQINIKLHPAELGELKIDLTVKEGSIRANVVAQSQHAQEILEKNMTKLRTVLEEHGFTVENITVSSKHDSPTDAGLFDRQLFSQNDYTPQAKKRHHEAEAAFRFDEAFIPAQPATTGVNVKI
ncbi:MAG TPA: hypothetical protein DDY32_17105 [Desulfobulbaceae bacterium]|nr:hypothetical protein [Desulfobulbaceae bacterium]